MREHFGDHSANERTLLAWIRTGIAIMAFGFLVEKFTLFLNFGTTPEVLEMILSRIDGALRS